MPTPNVLLILADDLGFSDLGCFGGEILTPSLDRLAARGTSMSSFYVTPRCSPSRAALLTGRHPHSVGIGVLTSDDRPHGYPGTLSVEQPTLAERLGEHGYSTALAGKWHLSSDTSSKNATWPRRRGFDEFYGILPGCGSYFQPRLYEGNSLADPATYAGDYYFTDDITSYAEGVISRSADADQPFFLYLAYTAPHWPLHAREEDIAAYRGVYRAGWDELRAARFARQDHHELAVSGLPPRDAEVRPWAEAEDQEWEIERMAVYAAQVTAMDRGIGQLMDLLEERGLADDTLIMFSSDNGACAEDLPPRLADVFGEDICPRTTRDGEPVRLGNLSGVMPGPEDTYASYGQAWANVSNTPFRLYKRWVHEGGIASPFLASWPSGGIAAGRRATDVGHLVDIVPTVMEAIGARTDLPGESLLAMLRGEPVPEASAERPLFWEHIGNAAIRRGRWKLVREALGAWELYDLSTDRAEQHDLSAVHPDLVADLTAQWEAWAERNGVIPWETVLEDHARRGLSAAAAEG